MFCLYLLLNSSIEPTLILVSEPYEPQEECSYSYLNTSSLLITPIFFLFFKIIKRIAIDLGEGY